MARTAHRAPASRSTPAPLLAMRLTPACCAAMVGLASYAGSAALPHGSSRAIAQTTSTAEAGTRSYAIAAGPLGTALATFASQSGVLLTFDPALTNGLTALALRGPYTPRTGLDALLTGSGLEAVATGTGSYTLRKATARAGSAMGVLPEVVVRGNHRPGITEGTGSFTADSTNAATGLNLSLRETPQSVTVLTRQRMDDQQLNSLGDVIAQTPGLSISQNPGMNIGDEGYIYSRGHQIHNYQVNGVSMSGLGLLGGGGDIGQSSLDTSVYDSVAIVRGATGLMTGAGNPSGSINLNLKRPTHDFQASLEGGVGRWNQQRIVADIGGPLNSSGSLRGRLVGTYDEDRSWVRRYEGDKNVIYGVLEADISAQTQLSFSVQRTEQESNVYRGSYYLSVFTDGWDKPTTWTREDSSNARWNRFHIKKNTFGINFDHHFNDDWQAKISYSHSNGTEVGKRNNLVLLTSDLVARRVTRSYQKDETYTNDINASLDGHYSLFNRKHDLIVGLSSTSAKTRGLWGGSDNLTNTLIEFSNGEPLIPEPDWNQLVVNGGSRTDVNQQGLYISTRIRPTEDFSLILGSRWSNWETRTTQRSGTISDDREYKGEFTPYAGIVYDLTSNLSAYASHTEIFNPQSLKDVAGDLLNPETGRNYEIGLKGEWFGGRLNTSVSAFQTRKNNLAVRDGENLTPDGDSAYRTEDNTKGRGWELEAGGQIADGWQLQGGYTKFVNRDSNENKLLTNFYPEHQVKIFTTYNFKNIQGLTIGSSINWQSKIYDSRSIELTGQSAYAVFDLMGKYRFNKNLSLSLKLGNVFDRSYKTSTNSNKYGSPRNLYATAKYIF